MGTFFMSFGIVVAVSFPSFKVQIDSHAYLKLDVFSWTLRCSITGKLHFALRHQFFHTDSVLNERAGLKACGTESGPSLSCVYSMGPELGWGSQSLSFNTSIPTYVKQLRVWL